MFEELAPATLPNLDGPLTQMRWKPLYHAINRMLAEIGANGEIDSRNNSVLDVMDALKDIDDGVYVSDF